MYIDESELNSSLASDSGKKGLKASKNKPGWGGVKLHFKKGCTSAE